MEEYETHSRALKSEDFSNSNFMLLVVTGTKDLGFQMKRVFKMRMNHWKMHVGKCSLRQIFSQILQCEKGSKLGLIKTDEQ